MKKLLAGISDFRKRILPTCRHKFAKLENSQSPNAFFISCSDSRVAPNWFASTDPGDLFVVRNVGNLVPPASLRNVMELTDTSAMAAAEFSVLKLKVADIVICGHSNCGAMQALAGEADLEATPHLKSWLFCNGTPTLQRLERDKAITPELSKINQLSQANVLQQIEHLKTHEFVRTRVESGKLQIHGWWFDISKADVYSYNETLNKFELIE